jgi:hypothetical protein
MAKSLLVERLTTITQFEQFMRMVGSDWKRGLEEKRRKNQPVSPEDIGRYLHGEKVAQSDCGTLAAMVLSRKALYMVIRNGDAWMTQSLVCEDLARRVARFAGVPKSSVFRWGHVSSSGNIRARTTFFAGASAMKAAQEVDAEVLVTVVESARIRSCAIPFGAKFGTDGRIANGAVYNSTGQIVTPGTCAVGDITDALGYPSEDTFRGIIPALGGTVVVGRIFNTVLLIDVKKALSMPHWSRL